jgi:hypothetical protein
MTTKTSSPPRNGILESTWDFTEHSERIQNALPTPIRPKQTHESLQSIFTTENNRDTVPELKENPPPRDCSRRGRSPTERDKEASIAAASASMLVRRGSAIKKNGKKNGNNLDGGMGETQEMYGLTRKADTPKSAIILK